jgi:CDP-diacylglycerol--glycerol-3-phosphate 3-phosphatidyltransferase
MSPTASFRARWSALHGGYDPGDSRAVTAWLTVAETGARWLVRRGVSANAVTAAGVVSAAAAIPSAAAGGRWPLAGSAAVAGSGLADGLDGAVAVLAGQATAWGFVLDSLADRVADALQLLALRRAGAPDRSTLVAAAGTVALEYARARAGAAGLREIGLVTVGERPTRILVVATGLAVAGLAPGHARSAATAAAAATAALSAVGAGQFLRTAARDLAQRQAAPISAATARADSATSGSPPPG